MAVTLAPVHIGQVIRNGVEYDPKNWKPGFEMAETLPTAVVDLLRELSKRESPFAIAGGIAMLAHVPGRNTQDLDLVMSPSDLLAIEGITSREASTDFLLADYRGLRVDVLSAKNKLFANVLRSHVALTEFVEGTFPCVTPVGMAILKLFALPSLYRQGDTTRIRIYESDVLGLLDAFDIDDTEILRAIEPHLLASDADELRRLVAELRVRIAAVSTRFREPS